VRSFRAEREREPLALHSSGDCNGRAVGFRSVWGRLMPIPSVGDLNGDGYVYLNDGHGAFAEARRPAILPR
jgi:hypothetical protein